MPNKKKTNQEVGSIISRAVSNLGPSFSKSTNKKYPYLGSRYQFDSEVFNPMKTQGPTTRGHSASVIDNRNTSQVGSNTRYNVAKHAQDQSLTSYFGGNSAYRKAAEKGAQRASNISSDYLKSTYQASKLLSEGKDFEADVLAGEARRKAFEEQKKGGFGATQVAESQYKNIKRISDAYYGPRIAQQGKNLEQGVTKLSAGVPKIDYAEMNASLRRLTSKKK